MTNKTKTVTQTGETRTRRPDKTPELFPQFAAGIERAKRVRVILRKLADWPADDIAALVAALRERADPPMGYVQPIMIPPLNGPLTVTCAMNQQQDIGQPSE